MRAPVVKIIKSESRLRIGIKNIVTTIHHKTFTILDYKPISFKTIQNIKVVLRNEAGKLVPITDTGRVVVSLKVQTTE